MADETGLSLPEDKFCRDDSGILSRSKSLLPDNSFQCLISTQFLSHCFVNITKKAILPCFFLINIFEHMKNVTYRIIDQRVLR